MKTVDEILREMRKPKSNCPKDERYEVAYSVADLESVLKNFADRIEAAVKAYNKEITELLREVIGGVCLHCDLQTACQEGEDGMSTTCNAVEKATHFIEQHTEPESGKDLPF